MADGRETRAGVASNVSSWRPRDPSTGRALPLTDQPGFYEGFSTLSQQEFWDAATRELILNRVHHVPETKFFTPDEVPLAEAVFDTVLPQEDRDPESRVPIVRYVDDRLHRKIVDGYRFWDMPDDWDALRMGLRAIEAIARHMFGMEFVTLAPSERERVLITIHDAEPPAGQDIWEKLPISRFWLLLVQLAVDAYYAHPRAWDEIGFGGPAYPRGYIRFATSMPEPWEVEERRYEWDAPDGAISDRYGQLGGEGGQHPPPSQAGTH